MPSQCYARRVYANLDAVPNALRIQNPTALRQRLVLHLAIRKFRFSQLECTEVMWIGAFRKTVRQSRLLSRDPSTCDVVPVQTRTTISLGQFWAESIWFATLKSMRIWQGQGSRVRDLLTFHKYIHRNQTCPSSIPTIHLGLGKRLCSSCRMAGSGV